MTRRNKETQYVISYVHVYFICMEEPYILPISYTISEYILIEFIQLKLLNMTLL
jgi:hypothetical protein